MLCHMIMNLNILMILKVKLLIDYGYPYIPYGKIILVQEDPGEGKTTMLLSIILDR